MFVHTFFPQSFVYRPAEQVAPKTTLPATATEQRIQDCGQTIDNLTGLSDAEMVGMADSVEAAKDRRLGRLVG